MILNEVVPYVAIGLIALAALPWRPSQEQAMALLKQYYQRRQVQRQPISVDELCHGYPDEIRNEVERLIRLRDDQVMALLKQYYQRTQDESRPIARDEFCRGAPDEVRWEVEWAVRLNEFRAAS